MSWLTSAIFLAIAVSKLNRYKEMEENLFGLQPQDRRHDRWGRSMENVQCSWLSIDWVKSTVVLVTKQQSDFSSCQVSDIPPPQTHTHNEDQEFSCQSILSFTDWKTICVSLYIEMCVCMWVNGWQRSSRGSRAVTGDISKEPGHINQRNRCLHAVLPY